MLIRFKNRTFNVITFTVFAGLGCVVLALTVPFPLPQNRGIDHPGMRQSAF